MDKKKIGTYLKELRKEKGLTQDAFACAFSKFCFEEIGLVSDATISKWERGESVPNVGDLKELAEFFHVSVDEILNGMKYEEVDFEEKYFIYDNAWLSRYNPDDLYNIREEQEVLIETRFKELLKKMVGVGLTLPEDKEFDFIVKHFYRIFLPAIECNKGNDYRTNMCNIYGVCVHLDDIKSYFHDWLPGGLSDIKFEIYKQTAFMHNSTIDEKFWEANKKFIFGRRQNVWDDINNAIEDSEDAVRNRLNSIENYEKDILLASLQNINVVNTLAIGSPKGKELYKKQYGREYDEEQLTKRAMRLLIECGAKLNKNFLDFWQVITRKDHIIDELERLHKKYKTPLLVPVCENGRYRYFTVDNTEINREKLGIKDDNEVFDESDYQELEKRLYAGERTVLKPCGYRICGSRETDFLIHARRQMLNMSLDAYTQSRDDKMTEELLKNLDRLPLDTIRNKYFPLEYRGEYIDDANLMSPEALKKKYYIKEGTDE